jgi:hypothetical protein
MRSSVVFPHPDGPTSAATSPLRRLNTSSPSTWSLPPDAARKDFCLMLTSSRPRAPAGDMLFKGLHQKRFDCQHDGDEGESQMREQIFGNRCEARSGVKFIVAGIW